MSGQKVSKIRWDILFNWALMNIFGFVIGMTVRQFVIGTLAGVSSPTLAKGLEGAIIGAAIGITQLFSFPPGIHRSNWWVVAGIGGWAIGWSLSGTAWSIFGLLGFSAVSAAIAGTAGLLAGVLQWLILRQQFDYAVWWVLASGLGWAIGMGMVRTVGGLGLAILGWPIAGGISGLITGVLLLWLLQQCPKASEYSHQVRLTPDLPSAER